MEMLFLDPVGLLGIILLSGATCMFIWLGCVSWFGGEPRRFWLARLTYKDSGIQQMVRSTWLAGWCLLVIGAVLAAYSDARCPCWLDKAIESLWLILMAWLIIKACVALIIFGEYIYHWVRGK